jgi:hypothetical protein
MYVLEKSKLVMQNHKSIAKSCHKFCRMGSFAWGRSLTALLVAGPRLCSAVPEAAQAVVVVLVGMNLPIVGLCDVIPFEALHLLEASRGAEVWHLEVTVHLIDAGGGAILRLQLLLHERSQAVMGLLCVHVVPGSRMHAGNYKAKADHSNNSSLATRSGRRACADVRSRGHGNRCAGGQNKIAEEAGAYMTRTRAG